MNDFIWSTTQYAQRYHIRFGLLKPGSANWNLYTQWFFQEKLIVPKTLFSYICSSFRILLTGKPLNLIGHLELHWTYRWLLKDSLELVDLFPHCISPTSLPSHTKWPIQPSQGWGSCKVIHDHSWHDIFSGHHRASSLQPNSNLSHEQCFPPGAQVQGTYFPTHLLNSL